MKERGLEEKIGEKRRCKEERVIEKKIGWKRSFKEKGGVRGKGR